MIRRLLALDGVAAVCQFRDDGQLIAGYGLLDDEDMVRLVKFAHDYRRMVQGNADQLSMFTGMRGWTPPQGWIVRSSDKSVCGFASLVCVVDNSAGNLDEIMVELQEISHW